MTTESSSVRGYLIDSAVFLWDVAFGCRGAIILANSTKILCCLKLQLSHPFTTPAHLTTQARFFFRFALKIRGHHG